MKSLRFKKLDAFAANGASGNPAGAVYLSTPNELSTFEMQTVARELAGFVSEVGFLAPLDQNRYWIRYYSAEREVAFCGHATIAIMYDLISKTPELSAQSHVELFTKNDQIMVENRVPDEDCVFVTAPSPSFSSTRFAKSDVAKALGIATVNIRDDQPISAVNAGLESLIVPMQGLEQILAVTPNFGELKIFCLENEIDIVVLYSAQVVGEQNVYRTRVFAPTFGYMEDPATGSGNAAFGHYLLANKKWDGSMLSLEQNHSADSPNIVRLYARSDAQGEHEVLFGGSSIVKIAGEYFVDGKPA